MAPIRSNWLKNHLQRHPLELKVTYLYNAHSRKCVHRLDAWFDALLTRIDVLTDVLQRESRRLFSALRSQWCILNINYRRLVFSLLDLSWRNRCTKTLYSAVFLKPSRSGMQKKTGWASVRANCETLICIVC